VNSRGIVRQKFPVATAAGVLREAEGVMIEEEYSVSEE
jgi:hypothetical protein